MKLDKKTIDCMASNGIMFTGYVDAPWSHDNIELSQDDIAKFIEDRTKFSADHYGLTIEQFRKWMDWQGAPQCGVMTKQGKRCKRQSGRYQSSAEEWLENEGGVCRYHENEEWHDRVREMRKTRKSLNL